MTIVREEQVNNAIAADAAADRLRRWGRSTTRDELAGIPVVPAAFLRHAHAIARLDTDGEIGNAGLIHVYGYLRSEAETPYGPKHARWTGGAIARALGLEPAALLPGDGPSTPIEVLTPILEGILAAPPAGARIVDETGEGLRARTVLLPGGAVAGGSGALLVYGVDDGAADDGATGRLRPVTVFPIADPAGALAEIEAESPRLRYNAVDGRGRAMTPLGTRRVR